MWSIFRRKPDICIGGEEDPYLLRWYLIPRNRWFNIYLHKFMRSDDNRALHDHPWWWISLILKGHYCEVRPTTYHVRVPWRPRCGSATALHRVELFSVEQNGSYIPLPVWTIFITGPRVREWGFQCGERWVDWRTFLRADPRAKTSAGTGRGPGCG